MWNLQKRTNSICCTKCKKWIHKKCSEFQSRLGTIVGFHYTNCSQELVAESLSDKRCPIKLNGDTLECVDKFCDLGELIGSGGGAEDTSSMRVKCAWGKFRELSPIPRQGGLR